MNLYNLSAAKTKNYFIIEQLSENQHLQIFNLRPQRARDPQLLEVC